MTLTRKISELMSFLLPPTWVGSKPEYDDSEAKRAREDLTASLTPEAREAISSTCEQTDEEARRIWELAPEQYAASPKWSRPDNPVALTIFSDVVLYTTPELERTDALLALPTALEPQQVTRAGHAIFSMWYSDQLSENSLVDAEETTQQESQTPADPALLEAFYEMKAMVESAGGDSDYRVLSAQIVTLGGKPAAQVETEHYCYGVVERQIGYHLLLGREKQGADWVAQEIHIMLRCSPAHIESVRSELQEFFDSITWRTA